MAMAPVLVRMRVVEGVGDLAEYRCRVVERPRLIGLEATRERAAFEVLEDEEVVPAWPLSSNCLSVR
jgi:hypothetical protein